MAVAVVAKSKDKCVLFFEGVNEFNSKIQDSIRAVITQTKLKDLDCLNTPHPPPPLVFNNKKTNNKNVWGQSLGRLRYQSCAELHELG